MDVGSPMQYLARVSNDPASEAGVNVISKIVIQKLQMSGGEEFGQFPSASTVISPQLAVFGPADG